MASALKQTICTDCSVVFDSAQSLEVHREYHKENLIMKWANMPNQQQPPPPIDETNNNIKRELLQSDKLVKSPDPGLPSADSVPQTYYDEFQPYHNFSAVKEEIYQNYYPEQYYQEPYTEIRHQNYRFHPYSNYHHPGSPNVSKHCDKCTYVCETDVQLLEHIRTTHSTPLFFPTEQKVKEEPQAEILDLDSQKVHVYQEEELKQLAQLNNGNNGVPIWPQKFVPQQFPADQSHYSEYRQYEHPQPPISNSPSVITSNTASTLPTTGAKGANWKSNEARRPKTYNCSACNKWFTSSGHLKRHYNTTLHKNAVKTSGHPDPATLPISVHHHPTRDPNHHSHRNKTVSQDNSPTQSSEDTNSTNQFDQGLIQQPPSGPYDRQPPPLHSSPPNGEAGPSANPRGLQLPHTLPPFNVLNQQVTQPPTGFTIQNIQNYPNELSPHVTMVLTNNNQQELINSLSTGDFGNAPLPSFSEFLSNVGGSNSVTDSEFNLQDDLQDYILYSNENVTIIVDPEEKSLNSPTISSSTTTPKPTRARKNVNKDAVFKCNECDKRFNKACYLTQHNKTFHSGDKPFKCSVCGKRFGDEMSFATHERKHAGDKPHKCEQCPKMFNHKTDLRRHMCLHSGYKPYSCFRCGKGFIRKDHMMKHVETHDRKSKGQRI